VQVPDRRGGRTPAEQLPLTPIDLAGAGGTNAGARGTNGGVRGANAEANTAPWPGTIPAPDPASIWTEPVPAELIDDDSRPVAVTGRGWLSASPAQLSIDGGPWVVIVGWVGPWITDERWWDALAHRRRARFQVVTDAGDAHLVTLEAGRWWIEASYD
jgi:protein ImuB